jgi:hypothetical protein
LGLGDLALTVELGGSSDPFVRHPGAVGLGLIGFRSKLDGLRALLGYEQLEPRLKGRGIWHWFHHELLMCEDKIDRYDSLGPKVNGFRIGRSVAEPIKPVHDGLSLDIAAPNNHAAPLFKLRPSSATRAHDWEVSTHRISQGGCRQRRDFLGSQGSALGLGIKYQHVVFLSSKDSFNQST